MESMEACHREEDIRNAATETIIPSQYLMRKLGFCIERNLHPEWSHEVIGILENTLISAEGEIR